MQTINILNQCDYTQRDSFWGLFISWVSYIELFVMIENHRYLVPEGCDLVAAGALPVAYGTSHVALVHRAQLHAGQVE